MNRDQHTVATLISWLSDISDTQLSRYSIAQMDIIDGDVVGDKALAAELLTALTREADRRAMLHGFNNPGLTS